MSGVWSAFSDLIIRATDEDYPAIINMPQAFLALARYREWRSESGQPTQWLYDIVLSFFSHNQGSGACSTSLVEGKTIASYAARWDYSYFHLIVYLLTYWSPRDIVYRIMTTPRHPCRLLCVAADAVDGVSTIGGMVDVAQELQPENKLLPIMAGITIYNSGQLFQCIDARARGEQLKTFLSEPTSDVTRGALIAFVYYLFGYVFRGGRQRNRALVAIASLEILVAMMEDYFEFDAFERLHQPGLIVLRSLRKRFDLGPPSVCEQTVMLQDRDPDQHEL